MASLRDQIKDAKARIDLRVFISSDLGRPEVGGSGAHNFKCPLHGEKKGASLAVYADGWYCYGACNRGGDIIDWMIEYRKMSARDAYSELGIVLSDDELPTPRTRSKVPEVRVKQQRTYAAFEDPVWQQCAQIFMYESQTQLLLRENNSALDWLAERGITREVAEAFALGVNVEPFSALWGDVEVHIPQGIVIPYMLNGQIAKLNLRTFDGGPKYRQVKGSAQVLYNASCIGTNVLLVEGEFDALILHAQALGKLAQPVHVIATGGASSARATRWTIHLLQAARIAVAFDVDENGAGDEGAAYWLQQLGASAFRWKPTAHDVTDMWRAGHDLTAWVQQAFNLEQLQLPFDIEGKGKIHIYE